MVRTQIYLTKQARTRLRSLARRLGRKESEIIREAIDSHLARVAERDRTAHLRRCRGMWKDRPLSAFAGLREDVEKRMSR
ncbi:MAG: CopG family transcriptional regulator [Planctomycetota bacterium]